MTQSRSPLLTLVVGLVAIILVATSVPAFIAYATKTPPLPLGRAYEPTRIAFSGVTLPRSGRSSDKRRVVKSILNVATPLKHGQFFWNEQEVPAGPVWLRVDLDAQIISVFRSGHEIGTAVVMYGADKKPTPFGTFPILAKRRHHRSSLYDADMPYTLRLTNDGISIHGANVRLDAATHGCVSVPVEFAKRLFDQVKVGDQVDLVKGV